MENNNILDISEHFFYLTNSIFVFNQENCDSNVISQKLGFSNKLAFPEQTHSNKVVWVDKPGNFLGIDGLVTANTDLVLCIKVADCVPVYFYDLKTNIISLVHSGWRGTIGGIINNTINLMKDKGSDVENIFSYLGPSIGGCCYEVGNDVASKFNSQSKYRLDKKTWKLDLHKQIIYQLIKIGIPNKNINYSNICTYESINCHSYRRDKLNSGRMYGFMELKL